MDEAAAIEWAKDEAERLRSNSLDSRTIGAVAPAREFINRQAPGSAFASTMKKTESFHGGFAITTAVEVLEEWVRFVESGMAQAIPYEQRYRIDAATDLMEQVQVLLSDKKVHPAVPVMLAGAALEEYLRGMIATTTEKITGNGSITKYGEALARVGLVDKHIVHQVKAMAATRNAAAHGDFGSIDIARAHVFVQQVNLFIMSHQMK